MRKAANRDTLGQMAMAAQKLASPPSGATRGVPPQDPPVEPDQQLQAFQVLNQFDTKDVPPIGQVLVKGVNLSIAGGRG